MRNKNKGKFKMTRRQVLKAGMIGGAGLMLPWKFKLSKAFGVAQPASVPLSDPADIKKFFLEVPDALAPTFKYAPVGMRGGNPLYRVSVSPNNQVWGQTAAGVNLTTDIYGYGGTWPGKTFEVQSGRPVQVQWKNNLPVGPLHLLPVDTSLHWCFSLHGYEDFSIEEDGVPIVTHLHGGHTRYLFDGNPEQFFTPRWRVKGPRWRGRTSVYENDQPAGNLWYHDHALGITRLNVYAGMAGFYFVRDDLDTGKPDNPLDLPAWPYEKAYAIQDRMFEENGQLFYPSIEDDPFWDDFIRGEDVPVCGDEGVLPPCIDPNEPTALAEFFGDHMLVNGKAWPFEAVEPRKYRLHLLNGTDSRFMIIKFRVAGRAIDEPETIPAGAQTLPFWVIGSDQGLASSATQVRQLVCEPGSRYDIIVDFSSFGRKRIIMENTGGDEPFGGTPSPFLFNETDRIMAFDVVVPKDNDVPDNFDPANITGVYTPNNNTETRIRKVALFEGNDEFGRLQPLLGTAEDATDFIGRPIINPDTGQPFNGAIAWHSPTTENPALNATEIWEIYNATGDAHPIHLHLVHFDVLDRREFVADIIQQPVRQHNGEFGTGFRLRNIRTRAIGPPPIRGYVENAPKDMVSALPTQTDGDPPEGRVRGQMTRIKVTFDKPGRYVWHCHILSHEDHEMMRTLYVGPEF